MNNAYLPYVVTEAFCIVYTVTIFVCLQSKVGEARELDYLKKMILSFIVMTAADIFWGLVECRYLHPSGPLNNAVNAVSVAAVVPGCYYWCRFVLYRIAPEKKFSSTAEWLIAAPGAVTFAVDLLSAFTGWVFYFDATGEFQLGNYFWVQSVVTHAYLIVPAICALIAASRTRSKKRRREFVIYFVCIVLCIAFAAVETYIETVPLLELGIFAMIQILFLSLYLDKQSALAKQEIELTESRTAVMLSQIQPHFLYNALTAIAWLCDTDPASAKKTTLEFSDYLRGNLDALSQKQPVPFQTELRHTQIYTDIEEIRFGDRLSVEYDIQAEDFLLPSLTVQPLVENAVKHGVGKKVEGGTVRLSTYEDEQGWYVTVVDDGAGFDPLQTQNDGRSHIGIENVRRRLSLQSGGTLHIESEPGRGTTAKLFIPKGGAAHDDPVRGR